MSIIHDAFVATTCDLPFRAAFARARCIRRGHDRHGAALIDKLRSEKHPHNDTDFIYTVNILLCTCGLVFHDAGLEFRVRP